MLHAYHSPIDAPTLRRRLLEIWERTGSVGLQRLAQHKPPHDRAVMTTEQDFQDWVSTTLMDVFKTTGDPAVFALLFELNRGSFLQSVQSGLRRAFHHVDAQDVVQEVFLNIYRYPHRFLADKADAFRGWGHRIARNTMLKFLKGQARVSRFLEIDEEVMQPEDTHVRQPDRAAVESESAVLVNRAYVLWLQLYLVHFGRLSPKEQHALTMVEVDGVSYRDAAARLGIRLENLKMVIFRGRRKIFRGMENSLARFDLPPEVRGDSVADGPVAPGRSGARARAADRVASRRIFGPTAARLDLGRDHGASSV
jgi:RNA polymerase sigma factor (sigma-70 family)